MCIRDRVGLVGPSFGPFDEFHGEDEGDGECDLSESLPAEPVGVAAQLTKVENQELVRSTGQRSPRVCGFLIFASPLRFFLAQTMSVSPRPWQRCVVSALS